MRNLIRRERRPWAPLLQFKIGSLARFPADEADMAIVQDRE
jgi:hypothetical protein